MSVITEDMTQAFSDWQAAYRHDRKCGTQTRNQIPEHTLHLVREYRRLKQAEYRTADHTPFSINGRLLPDDGLVDWLAVYIIAHGHRVVNATRRELVLAVYLMTRWQVTQEDMTLRLGLSRDSVRVLQRAAAEITPGVFRAEMESE